MKNEKAFYINILYAINGFISAGILFYLFDFTGVTQFLIVGTIASFMYYLLDELVKSVIFITGVILDNVKHSDFKKRDAKVRNTGSLLGQRNHRFLWTSRKEK